jgi:hypothetical protein
LGLPSVVDVPPPPLGVSFFQQLASNRFGLCRRYCVFWHWILISIITL